jgi:hypothetical protein
MLILIVPIVAIIYPLWSLARKLYFWHKRRRLYPMYRELKLIERELRAVPAVARDALVIRLDDLDRRAGDLAMPGLLNETAFTLRSNIQALRARVPTEIAARCRSGMPLGESELA